jgi:hypothetical protein
LMPIPLYPMLSFSIVSHRASLNRLPHRLSTWLVINWTNENLAAYCSFLRPVAVRNNWCQGQVPGRGPAVEKHCCRTSAFRIRTPSQWTNAEKITRQCTREDITKIARITPGCYLGTSNTSQRWPDTFQTARRSYGFGQHSRQHMLTYLNTHPLAIY